MGQQVLVRAGDVEFFAEVAGPGGPQTVGLRDTFSFEGVRDTVEAISTELAAVWERVKPSEASVEFGLKIAVKSGMLTGFLVEGGGDTSLKVKLTWREHQAAGSS